MNRKFSRLFLISILTLLCGNLALGVSVQSTRLPHPFQFTENKGQWDSAVLYKCEVRRDGFTWFLERDGITLVTSVIDSTKPIDNTRFDPMDRDFPPRYALKSHAIKFKFGAFDSFRRLGYTQRSGEVFSSD